MKCISALNYGGGGAMRTRIIVFDATESKAWLFHLLWFVVLKGKKIKVLQSVYLTVQIERKDLFLVGFYFYKHVHF